MNANAPSSSASRRPHLVRRVALAAAVAGALLIGTVGQASADIVVGVRPPVPRVEVRPVAPTPHHVWAGGYWGYHPVHGYYWNSGHWEAPRRGYSYENAHWSERGGHWHFVEGHWRHL